MLKLTYFVFIFITIFTSEEGLVPKTFKFFVGITQNFLVLEIHTSNFPNVVDIKVSCFHFWTFVT